MKTKELMNPLFLLVLGLVCATSQLRAEDGEEGWSLSVGVDAVSGYWWQGMKLADASLQPSVSFDYARGEVGLSMGAWASKSVSGDQYDELDLMVEATWRRFTFSVIDYYDFSQSFAPYNEGHSLDVGLSYTFSESLPLTLSAHALVLGNRYGDDVPTYVELSYPFSIWELDFNAVAGAVPMKSNYYDTSGINFVNLGLSAGHEFEVGSFVFPLTVQYNYNPEAGEHFFGAGIGCYFSVGL